ncbi:PAS domain-containing protein [Breoghania sp.]|uniref:PAS domain-containing protein n=1 Tax=Breoghania sp. TaxID=2065378 RepID=UPI002AA60F63|nr:PAS domain-containing protein [Breoghania sp.]
MSKPLSLTGVERFFDKDDVIVSKTDMKGRITYANRTFLQVAAFTEAEIMGQPHSIIRHPDMPRAVFKLLWDTIEAGHEIFAYVLNRAKTGDHYWVYAHVTPSFDGTGRIIGYHSNRRVPNRSVVDGVIVPLYEEVLAEEARHRNGKEQLAAGYELLIDRVSRHGLPYDELIAKLTAHGSLQAAA